MINSIYGKGIENLRKRINVKKAKNEKYFLKHVSKLFFNSRKIFDKNCAALHDVKAILTLNKPTYVGFTLLELTKSLMYHFNYNFI